MVVDLNLDFHSYRFPGQISMYDVLDEHMNENLLLNDDELNSFVLLTFENYLIVENIDHLEIKHLNEFLCHRHHLEKMVLDRNHR